MTFLFIFYFKRKSTF